MLCMRAIQKGFISSMLIILMIVLIAGCNSDEGSLNQSRYDGEGYILEVTGDRILVIDQPYVNKTWKDIMDVYTGEAIWLSTNTRNLKPGQKIQYKIRGGIDDSYPSQAEAKEIVISK